MVIVLIYAKVCCGVVVLCCCGLVGSRDKGGLEMENGK
jgi:hypothetical protein